MSTKSSFHISCFWYYYVTILLALSILLSTTCVTYGQEKLYHLNLGKTLYNKKRLAKAVHMRGGNVHRRQLSPSADTEGRENIALYEATHGVPSSSSSSSSKVASASSRRLNGETSFVIPPDFHLETAIIVDKHNKQPRYASRHAHVQSFLQNFTENYHKLTGGTMSVGEWPPVYTSNCPSLPGHPPIAYRAEGPGKHSEGFERGLLIVHKTLWSDFVYRSTSATAGFKKGVLIVFEDDVFPRVKDFVEATLRETIDMNVGVKFLGWCLGNPFQWPLTTPPFCTHAYAISLDAARNMSAGVIDCGPSIDVQMINMLKSGIASWNFPLRTSYDFAGDNNQVKANMGALGGYFNIGGDILNGDGIFSQRTFPG